MIYNKTKIKATNYKYQFTETQRGKSLPELVSGIIEVKTEVCLI